MLGAVLPLAYVGWHWAFYRAHRDYDVFGGASLHPSLATLGDNLERPQRFFALFSPELGHAWPAALVLGALLLVLVGASGRLTYVVPALALPVVVLWGMATPKSVWDFGRFLSPGRIFVTLPYGLWFLGFLVAESGVLGRLPRRLPGTALVGFCALALVSVGLRQGDFTHRVVALRNEATTTVYGFPTHVKTLERECAHAWTPRPGASTRRSSCSSPTRPSPTAAGRSTTGASTRCCPTWSAGRGASMRSGGEAGGRRCSRA